MYLTCFLPDSDLSHSLRSIKELLCAELVPKRTPFRYIGRLVDQRLSNRSKMYGG